MKYLGIFLIKKDRKDLYAKKYKTLLRETKEN